MLIQAPSREAWEAVSENEWAQLFPVAKEEGVAPILFWNMKNWDRALANVAPEVRSRIEWFREQCSAVYYQTLARNTLFFRELSRLQKGMADHSISFLALKGAQLATTIYTNIGLRQMNDLDLMIRLPDLTRALDVFKALGYKMWKISHNVIFVGGLETKLKVEVHWSLPVDNQGMSIPVPKWFWNETSKSPGGLTAADYAQFIYLAAHIVLMHGIAGSRLEWFYDLYLWLKSNAGRVDWNELFSFANQIGWSQVVMTALHETQIRFGDDCVRGLEEFPDIPEREGMRSGNGQKRIMGAQRLLPWRLRLKALWMLFFPDPDYVRWWDSGERPLVLKYIRRWISLLHFEEA